jgi:hypothetical protein
MGLFEDLGKKGGATLGKMIGGKSGKKIGASLGRMAGKGVSGLVQAETGLKFKNGGRVPGKRHSPKKAIVHGGEYVLPVGVKPTKAQKSEVAKRKAKAKK